MFWQWLQTNCSLCTKLGKNGDVSGLYRLKYNCYVHKHIPNTV